MLNQTKQFIENNIDLIQHSAWRELFINAYNEELTTAEVRELDEILRESEVFDSTLLRNDLLFEYIQNNIEFLRNRYRGKPVGDMKVVDSYTAQFLRQYLNNTFGFSEDEAINMMYDNQKLLKIKLHPVSLKGVHNYVITYEY